MKVTLQLRSNLMCPFSCFTANYASDDMRFFFEDCIDEVIELIQGQIMQVENKRNRIKVRLPKPVVQFCDGRSSQFS